MLSPNVHWEYTSTISILAVILFLDSIKVFHATANHVLYCYGRQLRFYPTSSLVITLKGHKHAVVIELNIKYVKPQYN